MSRNFTSTILFNKSINSGGAAFMEEKRSQDNNETSPTEAAETTKTDFDAKALFDSYMSEFKEESAPNNQTTEPSDKWSPLSSFHAYLDALEKEPDLYSLVTDGIKELRERVHFEENEYKTYNDEDFSLTAYDISLKKSEHYPENTYSASSKFDILYILLNWMQEAGVRGDSSYNDAYPLTVIQNEDISYIWSVMIFKDGTLKECSIGPGRDSEETSIQYKSIEDIQIEIADKPFQFSIYKSETIIKIGNLEVLTEIRDMEWEAAKKACVELGDRWRLPTKDEMKIIYQNRDKISMKLEINPYYYWTSEEGEYEGQDGYAWNLNFSSNEMHPSLKFSERGVLAVREATAMNESSSQQPSVESEDKPSPEEVARRVKEVEDLLRKNGSFGTENSTEEKPDFPPLTSDVIDFIDQKIKEKGGIYEIDEKEVEEIWESLNFDFALLDKNLSTEETNKWAQALVAYIQYKQSQS